MGIAADPVVHVGAVYGHQMPASVDAANDEFAARRASLLRAWGMNFRHVHNGVPLPWQDSEDTDFNEGVTAMRHIAAGMAIFADKTKVFNGDDWALFSGQSSDKPKSNHQKEFVALVEKYFDDHVAAYKEIGTDLKEKEGPYEKNGDYDFHLRDVIALICIFFDDPQILTNRMIRKLIGQDKVTFSPSGDSCSTTGGVPFSGQDLDEWLAEGRGGRHYFEEKLHVEGFPLDLVVPDIGAKISTPETENHLLGIYAWRFLVNEYLTYVAALPPEHHRFDPCLRALVNADPGRYVNGPAMLDFVLQLLGRIPHSGLFESNAKPYEAISLLGILAFFQAPDKLFPGDPSRQQIKIAAQNALDYLAAEFAFQSFEGKRMAPFRRNMDKKEYVSFYGSDYLAHAFGLLTGAYAFSDDTGESSTGPYNWQKIDQQGGFALWTLLSGYRVPRSIHDFMLNKHGGYFARIQTRYSKTSYPLEVTVGPGGPGPIGQAPTPTFARPRYFQEVSSGATPVASYDVAGPDVFTPVTQLYFATPDYLNSAGGSSSAYYDEIKIPKVLVDGILFLFTGIPFIPGLRDLVTKQLNKIVNNALDMLRTYDVWSRPSTIIIRGDIEVADKDVAGLERVLPAMRGQDVYEASQNLLTYKNLSLGYTFDPDDDDRHLDWPQRYPAEWNGAVAETFGIGRAGFRVFDFTALPDHPLAGHYWVLAQFSKSENKGQFREYGRGFWEVVPGHQFSSASALAARIQETNPRSHFDNNPDHHYTYRMPSTGETIVFHNRFGSTAAHQGILEIRDAGGGRIPLDAFTADIRDEAGLRRLPLMDVWQVDRDYGFTGRKYAHADGHGRVIIHNPFVGETLHLDSSDYRSPKRSSDSVGYLTAQLPPIAGTAGQIPVVGAIALDTDVLYATHFFSPDLSTHIAPQQGELVALDRHTLAPMKRVTVGRAPHSIAIHHATQRIYVVNYEDISLSVVDGQQFTVLDTHKFPGFGLISVALSQKYHRVFVTQPGQKRVLVIDGQARTPVESMTNLRVTGGIVVDEATDRMYVIVKNDQDESRQDIVEFEISAAGQRELRRTTVDGQVSRHSEISVDPDRIYVINNGHRPPVSQPGQKLTVLDRRTLEVIHSVPLITGSGFGIAVSVSQKVIYVAALADIQVIDSRTLQVIHKIKISPKSHIKGVVAVDERTGSVYFGGTHSSAVNGSLHVAALGQ